MTGLKLSEVDDDDVLTPKTGRAGPVYLLRNTERQFLDDSKDVTRPLG